MRSTVLIAVVFVAAGCASGGAPTEQAAQQQRDAKPEFEVPRDEVPLVIDPLVPQQTLPIDIDRHYNFAHLVMPVVVFSSPPHLVREQFLGPTADRFVRAQWAALHQGKPKLYPGTEVVDLERGARGLLIEMPPPARNAHAYFTIIVFKADTSIRYLTLERSVFMRDDDPDRTALGEWAVEDGEPQHDTFGEGPPPDRDAFLEAVELHIR